MKKNISPAILVILFISLLSIYKINISQNKNKVMEPILCNSNQSETDFYANRVLNERASYKIQEKGLKRQSTDGSYRKIFTDKNKGIVLVEDRHSGESGFRLVSVVLKDKKVVKIIDALTHYDIPPIEDPNAKPIITKDEFYVINSEACTWYRQGKIIDLKNPNEQEYLKVIKWIIDDAENITKAD